MQISKVNRPLYIRSCIIFSKTLFGWLIGSQLILGDNHLEEPISGSCMFHWSSQKILSVFEKKWSAWQPNSLGNTHLSNRDLYLTKWMRGWRISPLAPWNKLLEDYILDASSVLRWSSPNILFVFKEKISLIVQEISPIATMTYYWPTRK